MKVLVLGIDALDSALLEVFAADLPNLTALRAGGTSLKLRSTFPPDSDTAWATIATGTSSTTVSAGPGANLNICSITRSILARE